MKTDRFFRKNNKIEKESVKNFKTTVFLEKKELEKIEKELSKNKPVYNKNLILITKYGRKIPVKLSVSLIKNKQKEPITYSLILSDANETKYLQQDLERKIQRRTEELKDRIDELEGFREITVGRELRIVELKNRIKELEAQLAKEK